MFKELEKDKILSSFIIGQLILHGLEEPDLPFQKSSYL